MMMKPPTDRRVKCPAPRLTPIAKAVRTALYTGVLLSGTSAYAQQVSAPVLDEIVVTAQKRTENLQDVAVSVHVLDEQQLNRLQITNFDDYVKFMPSVSHNSRKPGIASIFMRGISDGGDGNPSGSEPSVAVYLNEQPVTAIGRNLDVHIYDIARIETLPGPQGTLFGASSQAGVLRIITNAPNPSAFEAGYDLGINTVEEGEEGYSIEGYLNVPISDNAAFRLTGWSLEDGGYIDNVPATKTFVLPVLAFPGQVTGGSDITVNNAGFVGDDFNEHTNTGARAALGVDLNERWTGTASLMFQSQETEGVWDHDPEDVGDLQVARFMRDESEDEWVQFGLTLDGEVGDGMNLVYAGSYLDRDVEYAIDYSEYSDYYTSAGFVEAYYSCYYTYFVACVDPRIQFTDDSTYKRTSHELRLQSSQDQRLRWLAGAYYEEAEHEYDQEWRIPAMSAIPVPPGAGTGPQVEPTDLYFTTDQLREFEEVALFGELYFDFTDQLTGTLGARFFDNETTLGGFVGTVWWPSRFGPRGAMETNVNQKFSEDDSTFKVNLAYDIDDDKMIYVTWSEGYRPGGANRIIGVGGAIGNTYDADFVTNYEFGWKTILADGRVRFNGAVYFLDWEDFQFTKFDSSVSLLGLTQNAGDAEVFGVEGDFAWLATDQLELDLAFSYNDGELTTDFFGAFAPMPGDMPVAPAGTELPFTPKLQYTVGGRYSFNMGNMDAYALAVYAFTDDSWNDLFIADRSNQDSYGILNASIGIDQGTWGADLFVKNLTDERAEIYRNIVDWDDRITTNRPRTVGLKFWQRFQ